MTPYKRTQDEVEWAEKKAKIQQRIAELGLDEDYEAEVIYAALINYLHQNLEQELRDDFLSESQADNSDGEREDE